MAVKIQLKKTVASGTPLEVLLYPGIFSNIQYKFDISSISRYELNIETSILEQIRINFAKFLRIHPRCTLRLNTTDTIFLKDMQDGLTYHLNRFCDPSDMVKYILQDGSFAHFSEILLLPIITTLRLHWNIVEILFSNIQTNFYEEIEVAVAAGFQTTKMTRNPAVFLRIVNYIQGTFGEELALDSDYFVLFFLRQYFHVESIRRVPLNNSSDEGANQDLSVKPFLAFFLQLLRDAERKLTAASELRSEFAISFLLYNFFTELTRLPLPTEFESKSLEIDAMDQLRQTIGLLKAQISLDVVGLFSCVQCFLIISEEYDKKTLFLSSPFPSEIKKQKGIIKESHTDISSDPMVHIIRHIDRKLKNALKSRNLKKYLL